MISPLPRCLDGEDFDPMYPCRSVQIRGNFLFAVQCRVSQEKTYRVRLLSRCALAVLIFVPICSAQTRPPGALRKAPPQNRPGGAPNAPTNVSPAEQRTARYFESIRTRPSLLLAFLRDMPKGGDLHNHLWGSIYAESFISYAAQDGLCVDRKTSLFSKPPCDEAASQPPASNALEDQNLYNQLVDAFSMRNWNSARPDSGHDHFFASFDKFELATQNHVGDMLAEAAARAAEDRVTYLELMHGTDRYQSIGLGSKVGWDADFAKMRDKLLAGGMKEIVASGRHSLDQDESRMRQVLRCGTPQADPGCKVTVRYLYQVLRGLKPEQVFAQMVTGFEMAQADPRIVGLNLVMPEDWYVPMHDFDLHMRMMDYLHGVYPRVHISLHAGELAMGLVPPEGLRFHIRESVERGHAERIGHGVSVMYESDPLGLMGEMAQRKVLVEICLTSNDVILGVSGARHPLAAYRQYSVPVALATDDEGVSRSDMTQEYMKAALDQGLSYSDLKRMVKASLEHSFLPGASLWEAGRSVACADSDALRNSVSDSCNRFLLGSEKARLQWREEAEFERFETRF